METVKKTYMENLKELDNIESQLFKLQVSFLSKNDFKLKREYERLRQRFNCCTHKNILYQNKIKMIRGNQKSNEECLRIQYKKKFMNDEFIVNYTVL